VGVLFSLETISFVEREGAGWVEREGVGGGGRNDPNIVCTYE
jgi:hypothetical protein